MRYEDWRRDSGSHSGTWWRAGLLSFAVVIIIVISVVDLATSRGLTAFGLIIVVGPALAVASNRPWAVAAVGAFAGVMAWATSSWQGLRGTPYQQVRLWAIAGMTLVGVAVAYSHRVLERRADQLAEDEAMLAAIVESADDAIIATDPNGIVLSWNRSAERLYCYTADEMIGESILRVVPPDAPQLAEVVARVDRAEAFSLIRAQRRHKDGHLFDVSTRASPVRDRDGRLIALAGITRDVSAEERAEQEHQQILDRSARAERLESLGQLAGGIAHDFNNLLAINLNYLEFALEQTTDPDTRDDLTRAKASAERARDLTRQLLVFAGKQPTTAETIDLNTVITETRTLLDRTIGGNIELVTHLHPHALPIRADRARLEQALCNLVINARDAMPDGGMIVVEDGVADVRDEPRHQPAPLPGRYACLTVTDTGTGMSPDIAAHVFEPLFTTRSPHHMGLGLATAYGIVTDAGGTITLTTRPGVGTTFRILLPLCTVGADNPATTATKT
ncbi:two-component system sensor histidine kinase NtrB [Krasilnikovia sp. MM14-A1004]|uniref:two-component system sensor histidine kinase NtrB n=1 Tax=Krasilnikovia sp. MM14-A1004 TaxID=3373541 RepID=UPI00399CA11D